MRTRSAAPGHNALVELWRPMPPTVQFDSGVAYAPMVERHTRWSQEPVPQGVGVRISLGAPCCQDGGTFGRRAALRTPWG